MWTLICSKRSYDNNINSFNFKCISCSLSVKICSIIWLLVVIVFLRDLFLSILRIKLYPKIAHSNVFPVVLFYADLNEYYGRYWRFSIWPITNLDHNVLYLLEIFFIIICLILIILTKNVRNKIDTDVTNNIEQNYVSSIQIL